MITVPEQMLPLVAQGLLSKYGVSIFGRGENDKIVYNAILLEKFIMLDNGKFLLSHLENIRYNIYKLFINDLDPNINNNEYSVVSDSLNSLPTETKRNTLFLIFHYLTVSDIVNDDFVIGLLSEFENIMFSILTNNLSLNVEKNNSEFDFKRLIYTLEEHTDVSERFISLLYANILNISFYPITEANMYWMYNSDVLKNCSIYSLKSEKHFILLGKLSNINLTLDKEFTSKELKELFKNNYIGYIKGFIPDSSMNYPNEVIIYNTSADDVFIMKKP